MQIKPFLIAWFMYINPLPDDKIDCSKLKQIADDIIKCI